MGVADPCPKVVGHDIDGAMVDQAQGFDEVMHVCGNGLHVIAAGGAAGIAHPARVQRDHAPPSRGQYRHHQAPCVPALWPPGQKEDRRPAAVFYASAFDEVQAHSVDGRGSVPELPPKDLWVEPDGGIPRVVVRDECAEHRPFPCLGTNIPKLAAQVMTLLSWRC